MCVFNSLGGIHCRQFLCRLELANLFWLKNLLFGTGVALGRACRLTMLFAFFFELKKVFLSVWTDLRARPSNNVLLNCAPVLPKQLDALQEQSMLQFGPATLSLRLLVIVAVGANTALGFIQRILIWWGGSFFLIWAQLRIFPSLQIVSLVANV
jgi:hypothetical protein